MRICAQARYCAWRHRRHHLLVHVGQEGVVDLHIEAGIDDGLVFLVQAVRERAQQALLVGIMLVLGVRQRARRRHHRQERGRNLHLGDGGFEVGDIALDPNVRIAERVVDHEAGSEALAQAGNAIVFRIEFRERDTVLPAAGGRHGILGLFRGEQPGGDAAQAVVHVKSPIAALAEFAVTDDVDAGVGLLADDLVDRLLEAGLVCRLVVGLPIFDLVQELDELRRPHQAADMGGQDAIARHFLPPFAFPVCRFHIISGSLAAAAGRRGLPRLGTVKFSHFRLAKPPGGPT